MERKYPVLKCNRELWEEIKPVLESFGITNMRISDYVWTLNNVYIVSNYSNPDMDNFRIGNTVYSKSENINSGYRYLVNTKDEFCSAIAKLLNKTYIEERNIKVSLEKAKEWYNSNNSTLKELALQAYTKEELSKKNFSEIYDEICPYITLAGISSIPTSQERKWTAIHKLAIIAEYLNEGWKPDWDDSNEPKWYIRKIDENLNIDYHYKVCEGGSIIFRTKELVQKAIEIMGEEINNIFE